MQLGDKIEYQNVKGYITFLSDDYLTYCIHEYNKPPEVATHSRHPTNQVNVLIFRSEWRHIKRTTEVRQDNIKRDICHPVE